jgi:hypothetical protein
MTRSLTRTSRRGIAVCTAALAFAALPSAALADSHASRASAQPSAESKAPGDIAFANKATGRCLLGDRAPGGFPNFVTGDCGGPATAFRPLAGGLLQNLNLAACLKGGADGDAYYARCNDEDEDQRWTINPSGNGIVHNATQQCLYGNHEDDADLSACVNGNDYQGWNHLPR